jgi:hypothetical protein
VAFRYVPAARRDQTTTWASNNFEAFLLSHSLNIKAVRTRSLGLADIGSCRAFGASSVSRAFIHRSQSQIRRQNNSTDASRPGAEPTERGLFQFYISRIMELFRNTRRRRVCGPNAIQNCRALPRAPHWWAAASGRGRTLVPVARQQHLVAVRLGGLQ